MLNKDITEFINTIDKLEAIEKRLELLEELNRLEYSYKTEKDISILMREKYETYSKFLEYKKMFREV